MSSIFDRKAFEKRCLDDRELIITILEGSMKDMAGHIEKLKKISALGDYPGLERCAHGLKGTGGTLSALQLHETAGDLEVAARNASQNQGDEGITPENEERIKELVEKALAQYDAFRKLIEEEFFAEDA